jgi:hypothetical protein
MGDANVNTPSPAWTEMEVDRELPRTLLYEGQRGIREGGEKYLKKYYGETGAAGQEDTEYGRRLSESYLVNFYEDAVRNLVGRVYAKDLQVAELHPDLQEFWKNVDGKGTPGDVFAQASSVDSLGQGFSSVLVDASSNSGTAETQAQENVRPKWIGSPANLLIEAAGIVVEGEQMLWRARKREMLSEPDGDSYDYVESNRVREFMFDNEFSKWQLWEQHPETKEWSLAKGDNVEGVYRPARSASPEQKLSFRAPPIVPWYSWETGFFQAKPPLLSLANLNLQHYQKKSDLDNIERIANVPKLIGQGDEPDGGLVLGAYSVTWLPEGSELKYLEVAGAGIAHLKDSLRHLEEHIRLAGREPMIKKATGMETATARIKDELQHLTLAQAWAKLWLAALNRCMYLTAAYLGITEPGVITISEDVMEDLARPDGFDDVLKLVELGVISNRAAREEAVRYGVLDRGFNVDEDGDRLEIEGPII